MAIFIIVLVSCVTFFGPKVVKFLARNVFQFLGDY
jgi:hypothetical protein